MPVSMQAPVADLNSMGCELIGCGLISRVLREIEVWGLNQTAEALQIGLQVVVEAYASRRLSSSRPSFRLVPSAGMMRSAMEPQHA